MTSTSFAKTMAAYNGWQNASIYDAASALSDSQRKEDRGAFFKSIHATLNHVLWADQAWLKRFGTGDGARFETIAEGLNQFEDWESLRDERRNFDGVMSIWSDSLKEQDFEGDLTWFSASAGREMTKPRAILIAHIFNHQTHHRGQVHAMLTGFGVKTGPTDLPFMV